MCWWTCCWGLRWIFYPNISHCWTYSQGCLKPRNLDVWDSIGSRNPGHCPTPRIATYNTSAYPIHWSNTSLGEAARAEVTTQFFVLFGAQTGCAIFIFILTFLAFPSYPKYAPSIPDSKKRQEKISQKDVAQTESYIAQLRKVITNKDFMMMNVSCAIEHGVFLSVLALDNRV